MSGVVQGVAAVAEVAAVAVPLGVVAVVLVRFVVVVVVVLLLLRCFNDLQPETRRFAQFLDSEVLDALLRQACTVLSFLSLV